MSTFTICRKLELDAAHRIPDHKSKCRNLHGHRYVIEATCENRHLQSSGAQRGMVLDFGFLKAEMIDVIHERCDHGLIVSMDDGELLELLAPSDYQRWISSIQKDVEEKGYCLTTNCKLDSHLYIIPAPPTAEVLAQHWFEQLAPRIINRSEGHAELSSLTVWETPNCWACYRP